MKRVLSKITFLLVLVLAVSAIPSFAQNKNESVMNVHVDKVVAIPGNVLEPGDYVFRLLDWSKNDVEVNSADGKTFYGILPVFTASRTSGGDSEIGITAPDAAGLARIDSWYFPGTQDGFRFIYSKSDIRKADVIARRMKSGTAGAGSI